MASSNGAVRTAFPIIAHCFRRCSPHGPVLLPDLAQHRAMPGAGGEGPSTDRAQSGLCPTVLYPTHQAILVHRAGALRTPNVEYDREPKHLSPSSFFTSSLIVVPPVSRINMPAWPPDAMPLLSRSTSDSAFLSVLARRTRQFRRGCPCSRMPSRSASTSVHAPAGTVPLTDRVLITKFGPPRSMSASSHFLTFETSIFLISTLGSAVQRRGSCSTSVAKITEKLSQIS